MYQELAMEVVGQLKPRFSPDIVAIKGCVDLLIDKEFLQRLDDGVMAYLA